MASRKELIEALDRNRLGGQAAVFWQERLAKEKAARQAIRARIETAEAELSERVSRAFGLNQVEFRTMMEAVAS